MTAEGRVAFVLFFFLVWCFLGLVPWTIAAVIARGRGALLALPLALAAAAALGVSVPLAGLRDAGGFFLSLPAALLGGALGAFAGIALSRRLAIPPAEERPGIAAAPSLRARKR
ncbi:MAG: hypothetical protein Q7T33_15510 [Dehalococcoidia bacterium]|nr:hypothetical protein [Dehalococcoidia bacterium]